MKESNDKQKSDLCSMTWKEVKQAFKSNPVILIPMGSIEQHGPQTPVGDYRYMAELARIIAERSGAISIPTIPWGYSEYFRNFPGCLTLRPETLKEILIDILNALLRFNLDHFVFVCGHKGNMPILEQVARDINEKHNIRVSTIEPLSWLTQDYLRDLYQDSKVQAGHGSDPMTSLAMYLFPDDVRMDLAEEGDSGKFWGKSIMGMSCMDFDGSPVYVYCDMEDVTVSGVLGNAAMHASSKTGERCMERMVDIGSRFVEWFRNCDTICRKNSL